MRKDECCRVQEEIKLGRGGRQVQISFPDDVLHSGRLQKMLETKVMILQDLHDRISTEIFSGCDNGGAVDPAFLS